MRLRYLVLTWFLGALVAGFALGTLADRHVIFDAIKRHNPEQSGTHMMNTPERFMTSDTGIHSPLART